MKHKLLFLLILLFTFSTNVYAKEVITMTECEYSNDYKEWLKLSDFEKKKVKEPVKCITDDHFYVGVPSSTYSYTDTKFDLREHNLVTGSKDQGRTNLCWAFASLASVESNLLFSGYGEQDLSEAHLHLATQDSLFESILPFRRDYSAGGNISITSAYLFSRIGPVTEQETPFSLVSSSITSSATLNTIKGKRPAYTVNKFAFALNNRSKCTNELMTSIKKYLTTNGAIHADVYYKYDSYSNDYLYYYSSDPGDNCNHAIAIIGWDDTISKDLFIDKSGSRSKPERDGAFIVKNSAGGSIPAFHYISYDDARICDYLGGFYDIDQEFNDNNYMYDILGTDTTEEYESDFYVANKFTKESNKKEQLKKVTIYSEVPGQQVDIFLSDNGKLTNLRKIHTDTIDHIGYTTFRINGEYIENNEFAIAIKYYALNGNNKIPAYVQKESGRYSKYAVTEGKSFMSTNGNEWSNFKISNNNNLLYANIKAYTDNTNSDTTPTTTNYTITFTADTQIVNITTSNLTCEASTEGSCSITLPNYTVNDGYKALGWYTEATGGSKVGNIGDTYTTNKNITLYARTAQITPAEPTEPTTPESTEQSYTITFETTSGINNIDNDSISCTYNNENSCSIILPAITANDNYDILGWYSDQNGEHKIGNPGDSYTLNNNVTMYAIAIPKSTPDPSITNDLELIVKENINNDNDNVGTAEITNPKTGNTSIFVICIIISFCVISYIYCNYLLKKTPTT